EQVLADTSRHLNPTVLTVFSAPNYCDRYRNKAAVLHIERPGYYTVNLLEAEPHPAPVKESDVNVMQVLAMGNTCPYMPTTFRDFLKVAVELGRAVKPTSTNTSTVTEDLAAAAAAAENLMSLSCESDNNTGGVGDDGGDGGGAPFSPALARRSSAPAEASSAAGTGGDGVMGPPPPRGLPPAKDQEEEDDEFGAVLPSSAPRVRRGPARIISAPVLGSGGGGGGSLGVMGGRRRRRSSGGGSPAGGGFPAGVVAGGGGKGKDGDEDNGGDGEDPDSKEEEEGGGGEGGGGEGKADTSFFGVMSSLSRRSMRGLGLMDVRSSSPGLGLLTRQNTWSVGATKAPISEVYRKAHARDGINEMHPEVLNRRISSQEAGELDLSRSSTSTSILSSPSTAGVTPPPSNGEATSTPTTLEGLLFGPGGWGNGSGAGASAGGSKKKSAAAAARPGGGGEGGGDDDDASPAPALRGVRKQFSLDMNVNAGGAQSAGRVTENKSTRELAALLGNSSITEIAQMDGDVEVDIEPNDAENDIATAAENGGNLVVGGAGVSSLAGLELSAVGSNYANSLPRSRDASFEAEGVMTPSPRSRNSSMMGESPSPSQILFTHEEIVVLKLLFSLFDRGGKNFITRDDIIAYAEEGGDFAQLKEVDSFME
ncbi:unnamed protein product, partial [Ectocarpus fasciculatus]